MKGAEFLVKETPCNDIFTYEDFSDEQMMMYEATKDFVKQEVLSNIEKIENFRNFQNVLFRWETDGKGAWEMV